MEPPGTETQALKAFFNDDLDNDSVCGTEVCNHLKAATSTCVVYSITYFLTEVVPCYTQSSGTRVS